jgi:hypothetical protein
VETWAKVSKTSDQDPHVALFDSGGNVNGEGGFALFVENGELLFRLGGLSSNKDGVGGTGGVDRHVPMVASGHNWYNSWHHYAVDRSAT